MADLQPRKLKTQVKDANLSDDRIPRNLILMYGDTPYIQKAGLEWKANNLFGGAGYSIKTEIIERSRDDKYYLVKATLTVLANNAVFENYGEACLENTNSQMQKNLLHLAVTRAECRVIRMATACGYASYDEVMTLPNGNSTKKLEVPNGDLPATEEQMATIKALHPASSPSSSVSLDGEKIKNLTKQEASELISELSTKK